VQQLISLEIMKGSKEEIDRMIQEILTQAFDENLAENRLNREGG